MRHENELRHTLMQIFNKYGVDSQTNTPDYVLAELIVGQLKELAAQQPPPEPIQLSTPTKVKPDGWSL